jgi:hypothetical protein
MRDAKMTEHPLAPGFTRPLAAAWPGVQTWAARLDWPALAALALPLLLYVWTLAPTLYNLDSAEFTTAVATDGLVRATGYPLYLVLGKLWSWLPLSADMGYRLNLFSAVCGAATLFLADRILRRLGVGLWARLGALGLLATAPYFWSLSLIAEVYTLHTALMAALILALLRWAESPTPWRLALPVLLATVSLGNHAASVLLIPGCVWFVLTRHPRQLADGRVWLAGGTAVLLGASIFLTLPLRYAGQPAFNYAGVYDAHGRFLPVNLQTAEGLVWLITGQSFAGQMFGYPLSAVGEQAAAYGRQLWTAFLGVGIGPALVGLVVLLRRDWRLGGLLLLMFLANAIFYVNYRVIDKNTMYLPTYLVWALWLGVGYEALLVGWQKALGRPWLLRGVLVTAVLLALLGNWRLVDLSDDWSTRDQSEAILRQVEPNALVFGWWDTVPAIQYLQFVEGQRPDVLAINRFLISGQDMNALILREIGRRPVYINNPSIELLRVTQATAVGPLYRLESREQTLKP